MRHIMAATDGSESAGTLVVGLYLTYAGFSA
jgi:hypothetical protein